MFVSRSYRTTGRPRSSALRSRLGVAVATLALSLTAVGGAGVASATTPTATAATRATAGSPSPARVAPGSDRAAAVAATDRRVRAAEHALTAPAFGATLPVHRPAHRPPATHAPARTLAVRRPSTTASSDVCEGALTLDTVYTCGTTSGTHTYQVTVPDAADVLMVQTASTISATYTFVPTVTAPDGSTPSCSRLQSGPLQCRTTASGTYTVAFDDQGSGFTVSYSDLLSEPTCPTLGISYADPSTAGTIAAGQTGDCYQLGGVAGDRMDVAGTDPNGFWSPTPVFDGAGNLLCAGSGVCVLTGTGPFRTVLSSYDGSATSYHVIARRMNDPQGCGSAEQLVYGAAPQVLSTSACRTLTVSRAANYVVQFAGGPDVSASDGSPVACSGPGGSCALSVGTFVAILPGAVEPMTSSPATFVAADETRGCVSGSDTGFADGPARGTLARDGQVDCVLLPTPSGVTVHVFDQKPVSGEMAGMEVVDATGAQQCPSENMAYGTCALTGTAPFRELFSQAYGTTSFQALTQRVDSTRGCLPFAASSFGPTPGARVTLDPATQMACFAIGAHLSAARELVGYSGAGNASADLRIDDLTGAEACRQIVAGLCSYDAGTPYVALLTGLALSAPVTYSLARRDLSGASGCQAAAVTSVGGASTAVRLASGVDAECRTYTASAADDLLLRTRYLAPGDDGALPFVVSADGTYSCFGDDPWGCRLTGSTSYRVVLYPYGFTGPTLSVQDDLWRVGSASGWDPACTAHPLTTSFGPITGTLTESTTAWCGVVAPTRVGATLGMVVSSPTGTALAQVLMYGGATPWPTSRQLCYLYDRAGEQGSCQTPANDQTLVIVTGQTPLPVTFQAQSVCGPSCDPTPTLTSVSPTSGASATGPTVTMRGTHLNLGTTITLQQAGQIAQATFTPASVSSDGTSLTGHLVVGGAGPGRYDVVADGIDLTTGQTYPGVTLPGAFTIGAAGPPAALLTPVTPARLLDTRSGLGAPRAKVASMGTVALQVAGVKGVPPTGVTAVVLNVTAVSPTQPGYLSLFPDGASRPTVSNLNFITGQTVANLAVVPVTDGKVDLYNGSTGQVDLLADVTGYFSTHGSGLTTLGPSRVLDTRSGVGAKAGRVPSGAILRLKVAGVAGLPVAGTTAVALTVTEVNPSSAGYLTTYPDGAARPAVSTLNFVAGQTVPNLAIVPVTNGYVDLYNGSPGTVDLLADVTAYASSAGTALQTVPPVRVIDTRSGFGGAGPAVTPGGVAILSLDSMPLPVSPGDVSAVVLNVTVTNATGAGYLTAAPDGLPIPSASNLNFSRGQTVAGLVVVPVVGGKVDLYNGGSGPVDVVADLAGYLLTPTG